MNIYRIIFAENEILTCKVVNDMAVLNGVYYYEHRDGKLTHAIIMAKTEDNALTIADLIRKEAIMLFTARTN